MAGFKKPGFRKPYEKLARYMIDGDCFEVAFRLLAALYGIETRRLNESNKSVVI